VTDDRFRTRVAAMVPRLGRFAMALTRARADAQDLVQMTCERALARADQWQPDTRLDSWLFRIMQTIWLNELDARKVRSTAAARHQPLEEPGIDGEGLAEARLLLSRVRRIVDELTDIERATLNLVCVDGLSYREAAEVLNVPIGTVMSRLARARLRLMERLEGAERATGGNIVRFRSGHDD
jgi:RNA polymerase sigma-70 factor (ECF subfamily)